MGFPGGSVAKNLLVSVGDTGNAGSIPGSGRSPGGGNGNLLQYSCLADPKDRGAWQATVHGTATCQTWLSNWACTWEYQHKSELKGIESKLISWNTSSLLPQSSLSALVSQTTDSQSYTYLPPPGRRWSNSWRKRGKNKETYTCSTSPQRQDPCLIISEAH